MAGEILDDRIVDASRTSMDTSNGDALSIKKDKHKDKKDKSEKKEKKEKKETKEKREKKRKAEEAPETANGVQHSNGTSSSGKTDKKERKKDKEPNTAQNGSTSSTSSSTSSSGSSTTSTSAAPFVATNGHSSSSSSTKKRKAEDDVTVASSSSSASSSAVKKHKSSFSSSFSSSSSAANAVSTAVAPECNDASGHPPLSSFPIHSSTLCILHKKGITHAFPIQSSTFLPVLSGQDVVGRARTGTGKCFARGTRLRLVNGATIAVEDVVGGEQLMGDDGLPRIVTPGSLTHGVDPLYRITPTWDGARPFTVNGAHILVLVNSVKPSVKERSGLSGGWEVLEWELTTDNRMRQRSRTFRTKARAQAELRAIFAAGWEPLMWEPTVEEYLGHAERTRRLCKLVACQAITFNNPLLPSLYQVLTVVLGVPPSTAQLEYMAWWLGMWLTDGASARVSISQGGAPPPDEHHHHEIFARLRAYQGLFHEPVAQVFDQVSSAGWNVCDFNYGDDSVAGRVLRCYGLLGNKHVPRGLICDSSDVRQRFMAGIIDGDGHYDRRCNVYELCAEYLLVVNGYKELAATLGLRNSAIAARIITNQQTGQEYDGHRFIISGDMWDVVRYCAATYKQCPQPGAADYVEKTKDSRVYGLTITPLPAGEYFGFAVHGGINRRFLLEDYTVTHNVSAPFSHLIRCFLARLTVEYTVLCVYKTLAFALPICERLQKEDEQRGERLKVGRGPRVIVLTPTRELAKQVSETFELIGPRLSHTTVYGGSAYAPMEAALRRGVDVVVGTCGRVQDLIDRGALRLNQVSVIILDEADEMLNMGFQDDVEKILQSVDRTDSSKTIQTLLFSATIPAWVQSVARKYLRADHKRIDLVGDIEQKGSADVVHYAIACHWSERNSILKDIISAYGGADRPRTIVFTETKKEANEIALSSSISSISGVLHGDIAQSQRETTLKGFRDGRFSVLIATDVAARGIDITGVELVVQCEPPQSVETYIHRSGRTGRAGSKGVAVTFYTAKQLYWINQIERQAKIKMIRAGPPQRDDIYASSAAAAVKAVTAVHKDVIPHFLSAAQQLLSSKAFAPPRPALLPSSDADSSGDESDEDGRVPDPAYVLAAALAQVSGHTQPLQSRSLLMSTAGAVTVQFTSAVEVRSLSFVWQQIRRWLYREEGQGDERVKGMRLTLDRHGAVFDVPAADEARVQQARRAMEADSKERCRFDICKKLPPLPQQEAVRPEVRRWGGRSSHGGGGGGRSGGGGRGGGSRGGFRGRNSR